VEGARPPGGETRPRPAAGARITVGHVSGALLVANEDVLELGMGRQPLIDGQVGASGVAEYQFDSLALQRLEDHVSSGHFWFHCSFTNKKPPPFGRGLCDLFTT